MSFCRIAEHEIRTREPVSAPDALIVQDPTLLHQVDVFGGLRPDGYVLINSPRTFDELGLGEWTRDFREERLLTVPAWEICREHIGQPRPNAAMLGGLSALTGIVTLESVTAAIESRFPERVAERNVAAAAACFEHVRAHEARHAHA